MAKPRKLGSLLLWGLLIAPTLVLADSTVYSNLNSDPANLYSIGGSHAEIFGVSSSVAVSFTPAANFQLTQLELAVQYATGNPANSPDFRLSLVNSTGGQPGPTVLFTGIFDSEPTTSTPGGICCEVLTINLGSPVNVQAGQTYWLAGEYYSGSSTVMWEFNNVGAMDAWSLNTTYDVVTGRPDPSAWTTQTGPNPAFAVFGVATPEPSSFFLVLAGVPLLLALNLTKQR